MSALPPKADMETFGYLEGLLGKMVALPSVPAAMTVPSNAGSDHYCDRHDEDGRVHVTTPFSECRPRVILASFGSALVQMRTRLAKSR